MTQHFNEEEWEHQVTDTQDIEILMHREAHFAGNFEVMIDYYTREGIGCSPSIDIKRIVELAEIEKKSGENLAPLLLSGADAEKIQKIRDMYKKLRELCEISDQNNPIPQLIASLILSEEHFPREKIESFIPYKLSATPFLIDILKNLDLYDPLFPGYGYAPEHAAACLAEVGDRRAIIALFESIGDGDFFHDEGILHALKAIGEHAKEFLLKVLKRLPVNEDNEKAAIALECFKGDEEVGKVALELLQRPEIIKDLVLSTYLIYLCEGLPEVPFKKLLQDIAKMPNLSKDFLRDLDVVIKTIT